MHSRESAFRRVPFTDGWVTLDTQPICAVFHLGLSPRKQEGETILTFQGR